MTDRSHPALYNGEYFDSRTEAAWANYFDDVGMPYIREPETFRFEIKITEDIGFTRIYTPDFFLPSIDSYVEVKNGNVDTTAVYKLKKLALHTGKTAILLDHMPHNASIYFYSPDSDINSDDFPVRKRSAAWSSSGKWAVPDMNPVFLEPIRSALLSNDRWETAFDQNLFDSSKARKKVLRSKTRVFVEDHTLVEIK